MYQQFFGFQVMPFNITPDPRFLYPSPTHQDALAHLRYGLVQKKGFIVLTGEVGCGKTTLCRAFLNELDPARTDTALILNPRITERELLAAILRELGELTTDRAPSGSDDGKAATIPISLDNADLTGRLNEALLRRIQAGRDIVLIIDEAQNLSFEVMEQLRLLSNLETDTQKLLQIILIGQPELKARLAEKRLRQLRQRILVFYDLRPLTRSQVRAYVEHRVELAGSRAAGRPPPRFTDAALRLIYRRSHGIPRLINTLCDKSLLSAFIRDAHEVNWFDARRAAKDQDQLG
jgi:general secretion pathway protein A